MLISIETYRTFDFPGGSGGGGGGGGAGPHIPPLDLCMIFGIVMLCYGV